MKLADCLMLCSCSVKNIHPSGTVIMSSTYIYIGEPEGKEYLELHGWDIQHLHFEHKREDLQMLTLVLGKILLNTTWSVVTLSLTLVITSNIPRSNFEVPQAGPVSCFPVSEWFVHLEKVLCSLSRKLDELVWGDIEATNLCLSTPSTFLACPLPPCH